MGLYEMPPGGGPLNLEPIARFSVELPVAPAHALGDSWPDRWRWPRAFGGPSGRNRAAPHDDYVYALSDEDAYLQADDQKPQIVEPLPRLDRLTVLRQVLRAGPNTV
jgi:hypothetical protein